MVGEILLNQNTGRDDVEAHNAMLIVSFSIIFLLS